MPVDLREGVIDVHDFATVFQGSVRSRLDWPAMQARCQVEQRFSRARDLLAAYHTVWYVGPDGRERRFDATDARPMRVREVPTTRHDWPPARTARIDELVDQMVGSDQPVQLVLPSYVVDGGMVLMDGNHRAVAAYLAEVDVRLMVFALRGPVDPSILPDLRHYH